MKTLHYAAQADHWTIDTVRGDKIGEAIYCGVFLRDKDGGILWSRLTPYYSKGEADRRAKKARTFAGTIIANFQSGHQFEVPILEDGKPTTCWPDKPGRELKYKGEKNERT